MKICCYCLRMKRKKKDEEAMLRMKNFHLSLSRLLIFSLSLSLSFRWWNFQHYLAWWKQSISHTWEFLVVAREPFNIPGITRGERRERKSVSLLTHSFTIALLRVLVLLWERRKRGETQPWVDDNLLCEWGEWKKFPFLRLSYFIKFWSANNRWQF